MIKGLKVFGLDPVGATTDFIKDKVEGVLQPGPGLYRWKGKASSDYTRIKSLETGKTDKPWLVFHSWNRLLHRGQFWGVVGRTAPMPACCNCSRITPIACSPSNIARFLTILFKTRWNLPGIFPKGLVCTWSPIPVGGSSENYSAAA